MKQVTIYYLAKVADIPPRTISMNVKALVNNIPGLKEKMEELE